MSENIRRKRSLTGWCPDRPDHRDWRYSSTLKASTLPETIDLSGLCPRVEDQGLISSCVAQAGTSAVEFLYTKEGKKQPELSRLFVYYSTRVWVEGILPDDDSGCFIRDAMKSLSKYGVPLESLHPYDESKYSQEPSAQSKSDALTRQIVEYRRCDTLDAIKQCLSEGFPVEGGFSVPENIYSPYCEETGVVEYPTWDEPMLGGHAVLFVGYDNKTQMLKFQNSWGISWGDSGFGYLPYQFVTEGLASDFWTIRLTETGVETVTPKPPVQLSWLTMLLSWLKRLFS